MKKIFWCFFKFNCLVTNAILFVSLLSHAQGGENNSSDYTWCTGKCTLRSTLGTNIVETVDSEAENPGLALTSLREKCKKKYLEKNSDYFDKGWKIETQTLDGSWLDVGLNNGACKSRGEIQGKANIETRPRKKVIPIEPGIR